MGNQEKENIIDLLETAKAMTSEQREKLIWLAKGMVLDGQIKNEQ